MKRYLNGWRRIGVCLTAVWLTLFLAIAISQYATHGKGYFVYWTLPVGSVVGDGEVTLPNGKVVAIDDTDPTTGRKLEPWQINWDQQRDVPRAPQIFWLRIVSFLLIIPLATWFTAELLAAAFRWIRAGFRPRVSAP